MRRGRYILLPCKLGLQKACSMFTYLSVREQMAFHTHNQPNKHLLHKVTNSLELHKEMCASASSHRAATAVEIWGVYIESKHHSRLKVVYKRGSILSPAFNISLKRKTSIYLNRVPKQVIISQLGVTELPLRMMLIINLFLIIRDGADAQYMQYLSKSHITSPQIR